MKHAHTAGPFAVIKHNHADGDLWLSINASQDGEMRPWIAEVKYLTAPDEEQWANAELLALAPTAPHDCDIPGCPGAENKRKLEAAGELLEAMETLVRHHDEVSSGECKPITAARAAIARAQDAKVGK